MINAKTKICIIIGDPVDHSLSPAIHNAGYKALGIDDKFVFVASCVKVKEVKDVVRAMRIMNFRGLTCTMPHKIEVMKYLNEIDKTAQRIGAVNTVVNDNGVLKGYNTDWLGIIHTLEKHIHLSGKQIAIIGAGGVAHAMAYGVTSKGARVTIFNRTIKKAKKLAKHIKAKLRDLSNLSILKEFDVILNATSLGMGDKISLTSVPKEYILKKHIVFDAVYEPYETRLLCEAKEQDATIIHGTEMLLYQGMEQFELYTGRKAPEEAMRKTLTKNININQDEEIYGDYFV